MKLKQQPVFLFCLLCIFVSLNVNAKPPTADSLSSDFYKKKGEIFYQQGQYEEACEQFMKAVALSNDAKQRQIYITLVIFFLLDAVGLFLFLYLEKQRAFKKLVDKNMQWAKQNEIEPSNEAEKQAIAQMIALFETDKVYRRKELTANDLATMLNINKNLITKLTNTYFHKTLPALLNEYRIKEAVNLLTDQKTSNYKMEAISDICGFNTRQVFHAAFKKETGLTPNDFRKMALNKDFS
ncbi:MAG: helix-turn-helix domain-containing protein [Bacteroidales bacterium]|nr:helix-turn-helix domain-containing protein [Bacteroidales bacterium]